MPILTPMLDTLKEPTEILVQNQILAESTQNLALKEEELITILKEEGLGVRELTKNLALIAKYAENEGTRLQAIRTGYELHGKLGTKQEQASNKTTINIIQNSGSQVQLAGILNPIR